MPFDDPFFRPFVRTEVPLAMHTWLQLGGPAEYFAEPRSLEELKTLLQGCNRDSVPFRLLGLGSNLLVSDQGVPGMVIRLSAPFFSEIQVEGDTITAGAGAKLGRVVTTAVHAGLAGLEGFIAIPGSVGGAIHDNILTGDGDIGQRIESVQIMTPIGEIFDLLREEIAFGYHSSSLEGVVIVSVRFKLEPEDAKLLAKRLQKIWIVQKKTQPMGYQNSSRLFRNPRGQSAAELVELVGLKGTKIGGAIISDRNANFVIVDPECSSNDVKRLITLIQSQVQDRTEVELEPELEIW